MVGDADPLPAHRGGHRRSYRERPPDAQRQVDHRPHARPDRRLGATAAGSATREKLLDKPSRARHASGARGFTFALGPEQLLHLAAKPYRLLTLVDGDIGPSNHLPGRHRVAQLDAVGKPYR